MVMLDRRKLVALLAALAVAFAVVLAIGEFTGQKAKAAPSPTSSGTPKVTARAKASATPGKAALVKLTIRVVELTQAGQPLQGSAVSVLRDGNLASVASGTLDVTLTYAPSVPAGQKYQVCLKPPGDWMSKGSDTYPLGDWICTTTDVGTAPPPVTFTLTTQAGGFIS